MKQRQVVWKVEAWDRPDWKPLIPGWKLVKTEEFPPLMACDWVWYRGYYEKIEDKGME